jgi:hypothetical protein
MSLPLSPRGRAFWEFLDLIEQAGTGLAYVAITMGLARSGHDSKNIGATMHYVMFVLSIIGFGLEVTAFLLAIAVI